MNELIDLVKEREIGKILENVSMKKYTTYRVGGNARLMIYPKNVDKLIELIRMCKFRNIKFKVLGNGSNTLFSDNDYDGVIIKLDEFNELSMIGARTIRVGAGYSLMKLVQFAVKKNLAGLEFAGGIPGTVGGAIYMNAGAYKSDMGFVVKRIKVLTPDYHVITLTNNELNFHYRTSFLQTHPGYICLEAIIGLKRGKRAELEKVLEERKKRRVESQPLEYPSAGSVFRNPEDNFAGKMIEDVGLKGLERGGAQISDKHANFIINKNNATANDIMTLINLVRDTIKENYGVELKVEQEFVNWE